MRLSSILVLVVLMVGCASSGQSEMSGAPPAAGVNLYGGGHTETMEVDTIASSDRGSTRSTSPKSQGQPYEQKLVKNGTVTVELDEDYFGREIARMKAAAESLGGYVASESSQSVTLRVPAGRLEELLAAANQAGEVTEQNIRVQDVTANYVDLKIRIDNLQRLRKRLQELVEAGSTVQEILEVEKELARVTRELEQLEGQMRVLENQVSYATLTVYFQNDISPGPIGWVFYGAYSAVKWLFVWD